MSYTFTQEPASITPAFNPIVYAINSSNYTQPNHRYRVVVKLGAFTIGTLDFVAVPLSGVGYIDLKRILSNLVSYDFNGTPQTLQMLNSTAKITLEFGETYTGTVSGVLATKTLYITNMGLTTYDFLNYDVTDYQGVIINKETTKLRIDSKAWLYFYHVLADKIDSIIITAGATVSVIKNDYSVFTNWQDGYCYFPSGANLNDIDAAQIISGTAGAILPPSTTSYTIELLNGVTVMDSHTYTIINTCYKQYELYYINNLGAFNTLVLNKNYKIDNDIERTSVQRQLQRFNYSDSEYNYTSQSRQNINSQIKYNTKWMLNTDWISETESTQLLSLVNSPVVYLNDNGTIKSVKISVANYNEKHYRQEKLFNFSIEVQDSQTQERQWGL